MVQQFIFPDQAGAVIQPEIYGNFSEHLGRASTTVSLWARTAPSRMSTACARTLWRRSNASVCRCCAGRADALPDEYHWQQGIGPQENRKRMVNTNWGGVVEDNSFGTHEFMELCRQIGASLYQRQRRLRHRAEVAEWLNT